MPDHFVVFDRVVSTKPEYTKRWVLHHAREPVLSGREWRSDQGEGRLFCRTLLPENAVLEKIGGPGREFLVNGVNYPIDRGPSEYIRKRGDATTTMSYKETPELVGRWRLEVRGPESVADQVFLHVIQVGDQRVERMVDCELIQDDETAGVRFVADGRTVTVTFARAGHAGGHIGIREVDGTIRVDRALTREVLPQKGLGRQ